MVIWAWALLIISPWVYSYQQVESQARVAGETIKICITTWHNPLLGKIHLIGIVYVFCYVIPLISISVFYALIARKVWFRPAFLRSNEASRKIVQRSKTRVVKMLLLVVFMFALSWLPLLTLYVYMTLNSGGRFAEQISKAMPFLQFIGQANSCVNPIIYCLYSTKFRNGFKKIMCFGGMADTQNSIINTRRSAVSSRRKTQSPALDDRVRKTFINVKCHHEGVSYATPHFASVRKAEGCCRNSNKINNHDEAERTLELKDDKASNANTLANGVKDKSSYKVSYGAYKNSLEMQNI